MISNLKALGLGLVIVLAMSAVAVSAASAAEFHAESQPVRLTGEQSVSITFLEAGEVECAPATFEGTVAATTTSSVTLHPKYTNCEFLGLPTHVTTTGCNYLFTADGQVHIECETGKAIQITPTSGGKSVCTVTVEAQTPTSGGGSATNQGSGTTRTILVTLGMDGLHYVVDGGGGKCGKEEVSPGNKTHTDGTIPGAISLTGENPTTKAHIGVWFQ